jgi:tryptophan halogenase
MPQAHDPLTESLRPLELDQMLRGMRDLIGRAAQAMQPGRSPCQDRRQDRQRLREAALG